MHKRIAVSVAAVVALLASVVVTATTATPAGALGARVTFTYVVRGSGNTSSLDVFAAQAAQTYADGRGWSLGGSVAFKRVASGGDFTLWLAAAGNVPGFGAPCDSGYSCRVGRNVVINETRWLTATPMWAANHRSLRDYRHMVINHETGHWLGFAHASCGGPGQLAPLMQQQSISLQGCRPNPWPLPSERQRLASALHVPIITGSPVGAFDSATAGVGSIRVRGWMIDPNTAAPGRVHVYVYTGRSSSGVAVTANGYRPDVARRYPGFGTSHGFALTVPAAPGLHRVCTYAMNLTGPGATTPLGCRSVTVSATPAGHVDAVHADGAGVHVLGWGLDPDTVEPIRVHVYLFTGSVSSGVAVRANLDRPDIARQFPRYGPAHGFSVTVAAAPGPHRVCVYAMNLAGAGTTASLGCETVDVPI